MIAAAVAIANVTSTEARKEPVLSAEVISLMPSAIISRIGKRKKKIVTAAQRISTDLNVP